jgi:excisionase family DNA binding protein
MTMEQAAEYLNVSPAWVRDHREIPYVKLGRHRRYDVTDLDAYIEQQKVRPYAAAQDDPLGDPLLSQTPRSIALSRSPRSRRRRPT